MITFLLYFLIDKSLKLQYLKPFSRRAIIGLDFWLFIPDNYAHKTHQFQAIKGQFTRL